MMKTCPYCASTAFEDMPVCYGCLRPFNEGQPPATSLLPVLFGPGFGIDGGSSDGADGGFGIDDGHGFGVGEGVGGEVGSGVDDALGIDDGLSDIEEPSESVSRSAEAALPVRLHVAIPELFGYDIYLEKAEGAQLTVGCARDNNIVLPHTESARHLIRIFYAQGQVWAEDKGSTQHALLGGTPLTGARCLARGVTLEAGAAKIDLVEE
jgi:hypothetical protein